MNKPLIITPQNDVQYKIMQLMGPVKACFHPQCKITLMAHNPSMKDADFIMTEMQNVLTGKPDFDGLIRALAKLKEFGMTGTVGG